ncbi:flagellar hook-basal body complex protein FliE [Geodermatophilus sp. SYSU D00698]
MSSPIDGISLPGVPTIGALGGISGTTAAAPATSTSGEGFAAALTGALDQLGSLQSAKDALAVQGATGDLRDVHDYMIAAQESSVATEVVVTLKNKAVEAFTEIMRMPV